MELDESAVQTPETISLIQRIVPKSEIPVSAQAVADQLTEVGTNLEAFVRLHNMMAILKAAQELVKGKAILQIEGKASEVLGAKVTAKRMPCRWDYGTDATLAGLEEDVVLRKKMLQGLTEPMANPSTGEIIQPAVKIEGGETLSVEF